MMTRGLKIIVMALGVAACGQTGAAEAAPRQVTAGETLNARTTPTVSDLLSLPPQAVPRRVDELLTKNQPRRADRFDLPPATAPPHRLRGRPARRRPRPLAPTMSRNHDEHSPYSHGNFPGSRGSAHASSPPPKSVPKEMLTVVDRPLIQYASTKRAKRDRADDLRHRARQIEPRRPFRRRLRA
jgi:hypothetical protein